MHVNLVDFYSYSSVNNSTILRVDNCTVQYDTTDSFTDDEGMNTTRGIPAASTVLARLARLATVD